MPARPIKSLEGLGRLETVKSLDLPDSRQAMLVAGSTDRAADGRSYRLAEHARHGADKSTAPIKGKKRKRVIDSVDDVLMRSLDLSIGKHAGSSRSGVVRVKPFRRLSSAWRLS